MIVEVVVRGLHINRKGLCDFAQQYMESTLIMAIALRRATAIHKYAVGGL